MPASRKLKNLGRLSTLLLACALWLAAAGCAMFRPPPESVSLQSRLKDFPRRGLPLLEPAEIYFDDHQLPFILARDDRDAPLLLGMVHAHLRLGQMELLRHAARGRLAELFGPFVADVDHGLRLLDLDRAVPAMEARLPKETRAWLVRYVQGINVYKAKARRLSHDVAVYGVQDKPWRVADVLAVGRLASADVNWLFWSFLLPLRDEPGFQEVWRRLVANGPASLDGLSRGPAGAPGLSARSGSNAFAVAGEMSVGTGPVLACDAHVGLMLPNLWLAVALQSPSLNVAGLCLPGLPAVLVGRNQDAAWGGTNMLALSSALYDVSDLDRAEFANRTETIRVRWWFDEEVELSQTPYGPVVSEAPFLRGKDLGRLALRWRGHEPSDEISAFLALNRAGNWTQFRRALRGYAVSGQNLVYADRHGVVGRVMAWERIPAAGAAALQLTVTPQEAGDWSERQGPLELPAIRNPATEMVVSANDVPVDLHPPGSLFGYPRDRLGRIAQRLLDAAPLGVEQAEAVQQDVLQPSALELAREITARVQALGMELPRKARPVARAITDWDGRYSVNSTGAAALEQTAAHLVQLAYGERYGDELAGYLRGSPAVYDLLAEDVPDMQAVDVVQSLVKASDDNMQYKTWGEMHRLSLEHPLANAPVIGDWFRYGELAWPGGMNTVAKSAHRLSPGEHEVRYGANARLVTDLGKSEVHVCLLGGQDGFLGSANFLDQVALWRSGEYLSLPLDARRARRTFPRRLELSPQE